MKNELQTTSWDNTNIYKNLKDPQIEKDLKLIEDSIKDLKVKTSSFTVLQFDESNLPLARDTYHRYLQTAITLYTLNVYSSSASSINTKDEVAKDLLNRSKKLRAELYKAIQPLEMYLIQSPDSYLEQFLNDERVREIEFMIKHARKRKEFLLSPSEEGLLVGHAVDGLHAWGNLYTDLAGSIKAKIDDDEMGLAQAFNITFQNDPERRKKAYQAINKAWTQNEVAAASILNAINGWRLENFRSRSKTKSLHFLDDNCHGQKVSRKTLETMVATVYEDRPRTHEAIRLMAQTMGINKLAPWDLLAPYPSESSSRKISFPEAMDTICKAFEKFSPEMSDFARMAYHKNWIDAGSSENRATGGYCTGFANVRESRIFMTYDGSMGNVITLAHELGHAYHSWVMRDLPLTETFYSAPLAETASVFGETLVRDYILENSKSKEEKKEILWQELKSIASYLVNIPARFEFEKQFVEKRQTKPLSISEIKATCKDAWKYWYGDTLSDYDDMFWASKLHFSISGMAFYNYPYLFGYLFSLGLYAKRNQPGFKDLYHNILRDTGRMTAEDLIKKHLNENISEKQFWKNSLDIVHNSVKEYKDLLG